MMPGQSVSIPDPCHLYIVRLPHTSFYDEMLRDQGYLDYIFYLKKNGVRATVIDLRGGTSTGLLNRIPSGAVVVIAVLRISQVEAGVAVAGHLKRHQKAKIILGKLINYGAFSTPSINCSRHKAVDYVIPARSGEIAVLKYLQGDPSFLIKNARRPRAPERAAPEINISDLPVSDVPHHHDFLTYELSRGCPNRCYYCANSLSGFSRQTVTRAIAGIRRLVRINQSRKLIFVGPEINFNDRYLAELLATLAPLKVQWTAYAVPRGLDRAMLSAMKKAGCRLLSLGLESADQETLDTIGKRTRVSEVSRILQDCRRLGIRTQIHIIVGFPYETAEAIAKLKRFILVNREAITNINISNLDIPKDSRIGRDPSRRGIILDRTAAGEFFPFYEPGSSGIRKQAETAVRIRELARFVKGLRLSCFTTATPFDESFEDLYLQVLGLGKRKNDG